MKKRILALFLCLLMIFAVFAGCGSKADTRPDEEKIIGRWKWTFDAAKFIVFDFENGEGENLHTSTKAEFLLYMDFYSDGTCSMYADEASIEKMEPALIDVLKDIYGDDDFREYLADYAAEEGVDIDTAADTLAHEDASFYVSFFKALNEEDSSGTYSIENGKLYFDDEPCNYEFSGNKLILKQVPLMTEVNEEMVMDIVLTRVS